MRIGVISDTHVPGRARAIPPIIFEAFRGVDLILHAGDLVSSKVLVELEAIAPVMAVRGNMDPPELYSRLPKKRELNLEGVTIGLIHGDGPGARRPAERALAAFPHADCVVYGHSHIPHCERIGRTLLFNPGSPTDRRREPMHSYGFLTIANGEVKGEIVRFLR